MYDYKKLILSEVGISFTRMLIGSSSTIYMVVSGLNLYQVGAIKSFQAVIILVLGFLVGVVSDRIDRKYLYNLAVFFAAAWLLLSYFAGIKQSFHLFFIAEFFNALSLCIFQNNSYAYLVDSYNKQFDDNDTKKVFGQASHLEFLFMSLASLVGGFLYHFMNGGLFVLSAVMMLIILVAGAAWLPNCRVQPEQGSQMKFLDKNDFLLIFRKIADYRQSILLFLIFSLYFQIIIQYWQLIVNHFDWVKSYEFLLGIILFCMLMVQSFSGKAVEKYRAVSEPVIMFLFFLGLVLCMWALEHRGAWGLCLFVIGICMNLFSIRYLIIGTNAKIHADIPAYIRAKYDMTLNTVLRLLTALVLLFIGLISEQFGTQFIIYFGLVMSFVSMLIYIKIKDQAKGV